MPEFPLSIADFSLYETGESADDRDILICYEDRVMPPNFQDATVTPLDAARVAPGRSWTLAPFAVHTSRGRLHREAPCSFRSPWQRDRDRIVHAKAFRRLTHKTQVFLFDEGDHFRNRLTHSLEVAQIARSIARLLKVDENLAEAISLAHDLGHTPFGHAGERGLARAMRQHGGFDHNAQSLRVVTRLETHYAGFDGLNLSFETLEGLVKHNGPVPGIPSGYIAAYDARHGLDLQHQASLEAQIAALSDDIAYNNHDLDDGLRAGLFSLSELSSVPLVWRLVQDITREHESLDDNRLIYELNRRLITQLIMDVVRETEARLIAGNVTTLDEIRASARPMADFSGEMAGKLKDLQRFLFAKVYRHPQVMGVMDAAEALVERLANTYLETPGTLPEKWRSAASPAGIIDFVSGMTDRYAVEEYKRLFSEEPELR